MATDAPILNLDKLLMQLQAMQLTQGQRTKLTQRLGRAALRANAAHIRRGQTPQGRPWQPIKRQKPKKRQLVGMGRYLSYRVQGDEVEISFKHRIRRMIAHQHHHGMIQQRTAKQAARMYRRRNDGPPSPKLAKALKHAGYTIRRKNGRGIAQDKAPSIKWIRTHLSERQAVTILKRLTGRRAKLKVPARQLLSTHDDVVMAELQRFLLNPQD
ncbi:phage virion morphogenesis protein [Shewanella algae]|uniref:phage virion morphogenesis protein n=1 Tax=Shewanella algae TaxID=38313 RepID=UPI0031F5BEB9